MQNCNRKNLLRKIWHVVTQCLLVLMLFGGLAPACKKVTSPPQLLTISVTEIQATSAVCSARLLEEDDANITDQGFCLATNNNPTTVDQKLSVQTGTSDFSATLPDLIPFTTYWVRAYATNQHGTAYGHAIKFTTLPLPGPTAIDADGNVYASVTIGCQIWLVQNLKVKHFNNGDSIPFIINDIQWPTPTIPRCCVYGNNAAYMDTYGLLYNWAAVSDSRGIAPPGWHIPAKEEWETLIDFVGGEFCAGKLKEAGMSHWTSGNTGGTNESGFTALPGGRRSFDGHYSSIHGGCLMWSDTEFSGNLSWYLRLDYNSTQILFGATDKMYGMSVRCIKD